MEIITAVKVVVFIAGLFVGFTFLVIGLHLARTDKNEYNKNRERVGSLGNVLFGKVRTVHDGQRDYRVRAGLAVDTKRNIWVEQGVLSEEALDSVLTSKHANY